MSEKSYANWRAYYYSRIEALKEKTGEDSSVESANIKYMLNEAETIRKHPDRLKFPNHESYPMFVMI